jgi:hypothetical protein
MRWLRGGGVCSIQDLPASIDLLLDLLRRVRIVNASFVPCIIHLWIIKTVCLTKKSSIY